MSEFYKPMESQEEPLRQLAEQFKAQADRIEALEAALQDAHAFLSKRPPNNQGWNALLNRLEALTSEPQKAPETARHIGQESSAARASGNPR